MADAPLPPSVERLLTTLPPGVVERAFRRLGRFSKVRQRLDAMYDDMLKDVSFAGDLPDAPSYTRLPAQGVPHEEVLATVRTLSTPERRAWEEGQVSGGVYHGDPEHVAFLNHVYALTSQMNPLHADLWPSGTKYEAEIVSMTAAMFHGESDDPEQEAVGSVTSGGTESLILAMRTYRDRARAEHGITQPNVVLPVSAHAAFDKAEEVLGIEMRRVAVGPDYAADVAAMGARVDKNTIAVVGSAPGFPHGVVDDVPALSALALRHGIGLHVDACLGGFLLPWAERLGHDVPTFDFRLPGVTSMSADTHKFGYAAKGTSVLLYRGRSLRRHQWFVNVEWTGGLYLSPTFAGSRPGALSAACWAAMVATGEQGYLDAAERILRAAAGIKQVVEDQPGLTVLGDSLFVVAFAAEDPESLDIYRVMDELHDRGWALNGLQKPAAIHLCATLRHDQPGVVDRWRTDLAAAVEAARASSSGTGMAPIYGMAGSFPVRGAVSEVMRRYLDKLYEV